MRWPAGRYLLLAGAMVLCLLGSVALLGRDGGRVDVIAADRDRSDETEAGPTTRPTRPADDADSADTDVLVVEAGESEASTPGVDAETTTTAPPAEASSSSSSPAGADGDASADASGASATSDTAADQAGSSGPVRVEVGPPNPSSSEARGRGQAAGPPQASPSTTQRSTRLTRLPFPSTPRPTTVPSPEATTRPPSTRPTEATTRPPSTRPTEATTRPPSTRPTEATTRPSSTRPTEATTRPPSSRPATTVTRPPDPTSGGGGGAIPVGRLYGGWCRSGLPNAPAAASTVVTVNPGQSIQSAIDTIGAGVVELAPGVHTISEPIRLRSNVVLRGASLEATIRTSRSMEQMVELGGGFTGGQVARVQRGAAFSRSLATDNPLSPGYYLIGDANRGQLVRVVSANGGQAQLELPLAQDVGGLSVAPQQDLITRAGLERVTLQPRHSVDDLVMVRSATDTWVSGVRTEGQSGQVRSAIYLRQSYRVGILGNEVIDSREHGDGGQGYGINIANNTSNALVDGNRLSRLRHSILLHAGASGNVVRANVSSDTRHPNFVEGGPADISFHGYAAGNLVQANNVERIQVSDAGRPGPHNALVGNTLTSGPLTLDNGVDNLTLLGNQMVGSVDGLRSTVMPSINSRSTAGYPSPARSYWRLGYDPFGRSGDTEYDKYGDGILDWGSGSDIYVDPNVRSIDPCRI